MMRLGRNARRVLWVLAVVCFAGVFAYAGRGDGTPPTNEERVESLSRQFACPECAGQSVAASNAPAARNIHTAVAEMVTEGRTDEEIRARIVDRFGEKVSLVPSSQGIVGLVWIAPVVVGLVAVAALALAMARWRRSVGDGGSATASDRALVEQFLAERQELTEAEAFR